MLFLKPGPFLVLNVRCSPLGPHCAEQCDLPQGHLGSIPRSASTRAHLGCWPELFPRHRYLSILFNTLSLPSHSLDRSLSLSLSMFASLSSLIPFFLSLSLSPYPSLFVPLALSILSALFLPRASNTKRLGGLGHSTLPFPAAL